MTLRAAGLSLFFMLIFTAIGWLIGVIVGMIFRTANVMLWAFVFFLLSALMIAIGHFYAPRIILSRYKAKISENKELNDTVDRMAVNAKIETPKVYIAPLDVPNSFVTGRGMEDAAICVTEGLLSLNKGEIENVVAHEMWHIANGDLPSQNLAVIIADVLYHTVIFIPLAIFVVKITLSGRREFRADYYATRYSKKPRDMASALNKMSEIARQTPIGGSPAMESLWVVNPFKREGLGRWLSTHPPTARRAKRVEDMAHEGMPEVPEATEVD